MKKSKLLIVTNLYPLPWEPNRSTFNRQHFKHLEAHYDVAIIVPVAWRDYFAHKDEITNTDRIRYVPYFYTPRFGRRFYGEFMYRSICIDAMSWIKAFKPNALLASWAYPEGMAVKKLADKLGVKYSIKVHGSDINCHIDTPARGELIKKAAQNAHSILSVSQALKDKMAQHGIPKGKISVIYNGVNQQLFIPSDDALPINKRNYLLYVGNLKANKGVVELVESFALIAKNHPELTLKIVGKGKHMTAKIRDLASIYQLKNRISLLGTVNHDELPLLMQNARAVCLPSYEEGVPNVLLESMSCGTPVVATTVGGIPEIVQQGMNGFLAPAKDSAAFAHSLEKSLNHPWSVTVIKNSCQKYNWQDNAVKSCKAIGQQILQNEKVFSQAPIKA